MRIIGCFIKSTPIHVMESELCLFPLHLRRQYLACKFFFKSISLQNNPIVNILNELSKTAQCRHWQGKKKPLLVSVYNKYHDSPVQSSLLIEMFSLDTWVNNIDLSDVLKPRIIGIDQPKHLSNISELKVKCKEFIEAQYPDDIKIYTDGSKEQNHLSAAFYDSHNGNFMKFKINGIVSVMYVELFAILEALSYIESIEFNKFVILTDSRSSIQHLARSASMYRGLSIAYQILKMILNLQNRHKKVTVQWIPSHVGIAGNERADSLARTALSDGFAVAVVPSHFDYYRVIKTHCLADWREYFDERSKEKGIWYKTIQPHPLGTPWIDNCILSRQDLVIAMRLRSGHIPSNKFSFLMKKVDSPNCSLCGVVEDIQHILAECVRTDSLRNSLGVNSCFDTGIFNTLLAYPLSIQCKKLYKMIILLLKS